MTKDISVKPNLRLSWRDRRYKRFYEVTDFLVNRIQEHVWLDSGKAKRRLRGSDLEKLHYSVECLVRDCIAVVLQRKRKGEASIHLGQYYYGKGRPDEMLTYKITKERAYLGLLELGYLQVTKPGYHDKVGRKDGTARSRLTRYVATDQLLSLFREDELKALPAIVPQYTLLDPLKISIKHTDDQGVKRKTSLVVPENDTTKQMRLNLGIINAALAQHWFDLEISMDELGSLQRRLANDPEDERSLRFDKRSLFRVFNDANLETGGRFYGGWWQNIPKEYRRRLIINRKPTVELDYSNQHPTILYSMENAERPSDCYSEVLNHKQLPKGKSRASARKMVKQAFNAMLNADRYIMHAPNGVHPKELGLTWAELSDAITEFHAPIAHHFYKGVGLRLQRIDSDIAELVMLNFATKGIPILPLHDSFLMHHGYETELAQQMSLAFQKVTGYKPKIDAKYFDAATDDALSEDGDDLSSILKLLSESHEARITAFEAIAKNK